MANVYWPTSNSWTTMVRWPTASSGVQWPSGTPVPPGSPIVWFDAQNIDLLNNTTLTDGQAVGTWKNAGSLGSAADATQATAGLRPIFRQVAASGKINNKSAVEGTAANSTAMSTSVFTGQGAVITYAAVVKAKTSQAGGGIFVDGAGGNRQQWGLISLQQRLFAGGAAPMTGQTLTLSKWQSVGALFNGASSFSRMDGAQSANVDIGAGVSLTSIEFFAGAGGTANFDGFIAELLVYVGIQSPEPIESYFTTKYGVTPQ